VPSVSQKDYRAITSELMSKICEKRQENVSRSGRTVVLVADIREEFSSYEDKNMLETIIEQFGENTGFYQIVGKTIVLNKEGKHECDRLIG
jgi:RNA-binding protein YhbY